MKHEQLTLHIGCCYFMDFTCVKNVERKSERNNFSYLPNDVHHRSNNSDDA